MSSVSNGSSVSQVRGIAPSAGVSGGSGIARPDRVVKIGGVTIGAAGAGIYSGYVLSAGDDFQSLSLVSAANPNGRYFTTRTYQGSGGCRAPASGGLAVMHDVSPDYTGWQDSNRGVPIASLADSHQIVPGEGTGALRLLAKRQSTAEQALLNTGVAGQIERAAMISAVGAFWVDSPCIVEFRARLPVGPHGQHPDLWTLSAEPPGGPGFTGNEEGFEMGNSKSGSYQLSWVGGTPTSTQLDLNAYRDGQFHTFASKRTDTQYLKYVDNTLVHTINVDPDGNGAKADYLLATHHILNSTFQSQAYNSAEWGLDVLPNGIEVDIEWIRIWRLSSANHYRPLISLSDVKVSAGGALSVVLPSQLDLWGATGLTEYVTAVQNEVLEPGSSNTSSYARFPSGITYDSGTRTLSGTMPAQSGALYIVIGVKGDGNTCEPARLRITVAPVYRGASVMSFTLGVPVSKDVYVDWDSGLLFWGGSNPKGLVYSALPPGLSFDSTTGLLTGTPTAAGNGSMSASATNSANQTTAVSVQYVVLDPADGVAAPTLTGDPALIASFDFGQAACVKSSNGAIDTVFGADGTLVALSGAGSTRPAFSTRIANGVSRGVADFTAASQHILSALSGLGIGAAGCTLVVVGEPKTAATAASVIEVQQASATATVNRVALLNGSGTNGWGARKCGSSGGNQDANQGSAYSVALTLVIGMAKAGSSGSQLNINGVATGVTSAGAAANPAVTDLLTLGGRSVSGVLGNFWGGYIWRLLIYPSQLSATNLEQIATWAAANYGTTNAA